MATSYGFSPKQLSPALWLADKGNDPAIWEDLSGNGRHATQANAGDRPTIVTNTLNGRQVRRFDNLSDFYTTGFSVVNGLNYTIIAIVNQRQSSNLAFSGYGSLIASAGRGGTDAVVLRLGTQTYSNVQTVYGGATNSNFKNGSSANITFSGYPAGWAIVTSISDPINISLESAKTVLISSYRDSNNTPSWFSGSDIAEILIFPTALSTSNRQLIEKYLSTKYNIALWTNLEPETISFASTSGASDLSAIDNIVKYAKSENIFNDIRLFTFKSSQNKGSGSTVYGIGGWTSNNITLIGGPVWGAAGLSFDASDDRGTWDATGFRSISECFTFDRQSPAAGSLPDNGRLGTITAANNNSTYWLGWQSATGLLAGETFAIGITSPSGSARKGGTFSWSAGQNIQVVWRHASTGQLWLNKTEQSTYLTSGTQDFRPSIAGLTNDIININADLYTGTPSAFVQTTRTALMFCKASLTQTQRETLTDLINSL